MGHRNARLNVRGRVLLVERVLDRAHHGGDERKSVDPNGCSRNACIGTPRVRLARPWTPT